MLTGQLALAAASLFFGAAIYITLAEQPARLALDDGALIDEWKPAYKRGFAIQAPLALFGFACGLIAWWQTRDWLWFAGALVLVANWPYTLIVLMPTNALLMKAKPAEAGPKTRALVEKWGRLHAARSALGCGAMVIFLWAAAR